MVPTGLEPTQFSTTDYSVKRLDHSATEAVTQYAFHAFYMYAQYQISGMRAFEGIVAIATIEFAPNVPPN